MTLFFWWSVVFVYVGLLVLVVDLLFLERFSSRFAFIALILGLGYAFTEGIVRHDDPLVTSSSFQVSPFSDAPVIGGITWTPDLRELTVSLGNNTDDSYSDLDFNIQTDAIIQAKGHADSVPNVVFDDSELTAQRNLGTGVQRLRVSQNHYRVMCPLLPRFQSLTLVFAISSQDINAIKAVRINGQYKGKFQVRRIGSRSPPATLSLTRQ